MPEELLSPVEDGLPLRQAGPQAVDKLDYLARYMDMFTTAMRGMPWRKIRYIDLFSGPGKCIIRDTDQVILGSPLLALGTKHEFGECVFVDIASSNVNALEKRCAASARSQTVTVKAGDSNGLVRALVDELEAEDRARSSGQWQSLNLAFLDPEGFELHWSTVQQLARLRTDLIIFYPQSGLQRNFDLFLARNDDTLADQYFGSREWRRVYLQHLNRHGASGIHRVLMDHYRENLISLGYATVARGYEIEPLMRAPRTKAPLYRLLFASKHPLGHKFWRSVTQRDSHGQQRLL